MPSPFGMLRNTLFKDREEMRRIKAGVARGMQMPINRRRNIRPETGLLEIGVAPYFRDLTRGAGVAFDIGTHLGYYVLAFAKQRVPQIVAFEPDAVVLPGLRKTLTTNHLTERVTIVDRFVARHSDGKSISLDEAIRDGALPSPDILKMDIDGGEVDALEGAGDLLRTTHPSLIIEVHSVELENAVIELIKAAGYTRLDVIDNGPVIARIAPELRLPATHNRWLAAWHTDRVTHDVAKRRLPGMTFSERLV